MEVNDVTGDVAREVAAPSSSSRKNNTPPNQEVSAQTQSVSDPVQIDLTTREDSASANDVRTSLNRVITIVNVASEATDQIGKIVQSLGGIAEQAAESSLPENRREALTKEATNLVAELQKVIQTKAPDGSRPLAGDSVRVEVEEKLGKALDLLLPDHSRSSLGLINLNFSTKESIIQTKTTIETARRQLEDLRQAIDSSRIQVQELAVRVEVAGQNSEAAQSSVRDLDTALALAGKTQKGIEDHPEDAMRSVGRIHDVVQDLLK